MATRRSGGRRCQQATSSIQPGPCGLWSHQWRNSPQIRYVAHLCLSMETLPRTTDPVLAIGPSVLRIANRLSTARNA